MEAESWQEFGLKLAPIMQSLELSSHQVQERLETLWIPLAKQLIDWRKGLNRPLIQGILGAQGTGKTTLAKVLATILETWGYPTLQFSIDDLYKTYADRQQLKQENPELIWRGPPGTHDIELGIQVLEQVQNQNFPVAVPRFDKSLWNGEGDRVSPQLISTAEIVLFEGWFVGMRPIDPESFITAPAPILTETDRNFAKKINESLQKYLPLWDKLDRLIILYPIDYQMSLEWRKQAEQEMIKLGKTGMSDLQIEGFVYYFWRSLHPELFFPPLLNSEQVDLVLKLDCDRTLNSIYSPRHQASHFQNYYPDSIINGYDINKN